MILKNTWQALRVRSFSRVDPSRFDGLAPRAGAGMIGGGFAAIVLVGLGETLPSALSICAAWLLFTFLGGRAAGGADILLFGRVQARREDRWTHAYVFGLCGYLMACWLLSAQSLRNLICVFLVISTFTYGLNKLVCNHFGCCSCSRFELPRYESIATLVATGIAVGVSQAGIHGMAMVCVSMYVVVRTTSVLVRRKKLRSEFPWDVLLALLGGISLNAQLVTT